jgi:hypothetical protein
MVGVIGPLVQGKRELRGSGRSIALFTVGAMAGAALTGVAIGVLAGAVRLAWDVPALAVGAAGCVLLLADLGIFGLRTPTLLRQTCSTWYREGGRQSVWALWGFDLGLGFSTIRLSSLYWLMVLFVAAFVSPWLAPVVLACYGLGLGVAFGAALVAQARSTPRPGASPGLGLLHAASRVRLASVAFLGVVSIAIVISGAAWS